MSANLEAGLILYFSLYLDYVLQRALSVAEGEQKEALINKVRPQLANMRRYSSAYSKHLVSSAITLPSVLSVILPNCLYVFSRTSRRKMRHFIHPR
jgi:hypothetical protein